MTSSEADTVSQILANQRENESKFKSIDVFKEVDPVIDLGNLLLIDLQPVNSDELKSKSEQFLIDLARDNAQLLFNQIWKLPIERVDNIVLAKLPQPSTLLPREKPIPKAKPPTKWEIYAKKKGIEKKKRSRMLWDEESKTWKPRHGYKRTKDDTKEWCIEVPQNADQNEDQFEKKEIAKKERVAKNEIKRLGNIARNTKKGITPSLQFKPTLEKDKTRVSKEIDVAKVSTASMGKFQPKLPNEKENKKTGQKRKFESVSGSGINEKQRALDILKKINKPGKLDLTKAVNKKVYEDKEGSSKFSSGKVKNKRFRKGKQATLDKMKSRTLGKGRKKR